MKKSAKVFALILTCVFMMAMFSSVALAAGDVKMSFTTQNKTLDVGQKIKVLCHFDSTSDIATFQFLVTYDKTRLQYETAKGMGMDTGELDIVAKDGGVEFLYLDEEAGGSPLKKGSLDVLELTFKVIKTGSSQIDANTASPYVFGDPDVKEIPVTVTPLTLALTGTDAPQTPWGLLAVLVVAAGIVAVLIVVMMKRKAKTQGTTAEGIDS